MPTDELKYMIIACHGFRGGKENAGQIFSFATKLNKHNIGVIAFDFSGCGESSGLYEDITLSRQVNDLLSVIEYTYNSFKVPIILLGRSFGGSTVLGTNINDERIIGYILWSTPILLHETFSTIFRDEYNELKKGKSITINDNGEIFKLNPKLVKDFDSHNFDQYLTTIKDRPVLVVHGMEDDVVDPKNAISIKNYVKNCRLYLVKGADHRFMGMSNEREDLTIKWILDKYF